MENKKPESKSEALKTETTATPSLQETVRTVVTELIPALVAAQQTVQQQAPIAVTPTYPRPEEKNRSRCNVCRQVVTACGGKHVRLAVFPSRTPDKIQFFPGAGINGVWYRSTHDGDYVDVPENAVSQVLTAIRSFEAEELRLNVSSTGGNYLGRLGTNGSQVNQPVQMGWR